MARAAVRFHPEAAGEAEAAFGWYAGHNAAGAHGFREELRHAVTQIAEIVETGAFERHLGAAARF